MLNLIVNPYAGGGLAKNNTRIITKYLKKSKIPYLVYFCEQESDVEEFVSELFKAGEKEYILIGGDGTIHKFANSIDLSKVNFGVIPSGYFNNFAKSVGLEFNPIKGIEKILEQNIEQFDYIKCNHVNAINYVAIGCIEEIKHKLKDNNRRPNSFDYLKNLNKCSPLELTIVAKDIKEKNQIVNECYVANGIYKDKSKISPLSNLQDGLFNLICVTNNGKRKITDYLKIKRGKHIYNEQNNTYWLESAIITATNTPLKVEIDGKLYEMEKLELSTVENGLNLYI